MGRTLKALAKRDIDKKAIFDKRFVIELCERVHLHYRNLRINLSLDDFIEIANGMIKAMERWTKRGGLAPKDGRHIELTRRGVGRETYNDGIQVNLNKNLYNDNAGKVFAEGADFNDEKYIHLKIRDLRVELSLEDFDKLAETVKEAHENLHSDTVL